MRALAVIFGVVAAMLVLEARSSPPKPSDTVAMLSECDGAISQIVIHYVAGDTSAWPVYRSFLPQLPGDVRVYVVCPDRAAFDELAHLIGQVSCRMMPVTVGHPITVWSRDRWVAVASLDPNHPMTLLAPRNEAGAELWPARAGDARTADDLAESLAPDVLSTRLPLFFDGGDLLADDQTVFITPSVLTKNLQRTVNSRSELIELLARHLGKRIVVLDRAPDHHAGMYMMAAGHRTMLVGDPSLGKSLIGPEIVAELPGGADFSQQTQDLFNAVAGRVSSEGYRVIRIPTVLSPDQKTYLTYVNVISDHRDGRDVVYLPQYNGADRLNAAAADVWRQLGYEVRPVDCTSSFKAFGNLHCLVNVLRRGTPASARTM